MSNAIFAKSLAAKVERIVREHGLTRKPLLTEVRVFVEEAVKMALPSWNGQRFDGLTTLLGGSGARPIGRVMTRRRPLRKSP
jgi:hypothetical protein